MIQKNLITVEVTHVEIIRQKTLGGAINLCATAAGFEAKEVCHLIGGSDKAQYSRWVNNQEGIKFEKLQALMDACGNDAPLFWMLQVRGYDLSSLRKTESQTEHALRIEREARLKVEQENEILRSVLIGKAAA